MASLFKKKFQEINDYPDTWTILRGTYDGRPIFIRLRESMKQAIGHPDYPFQMGVAIPLKNPGTECLITDGEAEQLHAIEDLLTKALCENQAAVLVMVITTAGMREFIYYTKDWKPEYFKERVNDIEKHTRTHELQFIMRHDPDWSIFKQFTG